MTGHLDDLLSAYADGQLLAPEHAEVESHLAGCPTCRAELDATRQAKAWVSGLPEVLPPFGFYERIMLDPSGPRERRARLATRVGAISLAATASIWFAVVGLSGLDTNRPGGLPALNSLISLHETETASASPQGATAEEVQQAAELGLRPEIDGYQLTAVNDLGEEHQVVYADDDQSMSIFVWQNYDIDESRLPIGTVGKVYGGHPVWVVPHDPEPLIVAQLGVNAYVFVGPEPAAPGMAEGVEPAASSRSMLDGVKGAGEGLLEAFGLG
jgi:hypothetical protein